MFKGTIVTRRNLELKMEGQDANERGAYKKKDGFQRRGIKKQASKKKKKQEEH